MLSILIPIYNYDVTELVGCLQSSFSNKPSAFEYEILCYDDASDNKELHSINNKLNELDNVTYKVLDKNLGRSQIRNLLAKESKGDWLLFLDCDSLPCHKDFIANYLQQTNDADVVCGGTKYQDKSQISKEYLLHWKNGKKREENQKHFTTNNFLIKKDIFLNICFEQTLTGYGHEDTIFGQELQHNNYKIKHIDNAVYHLGLKNTDKFLSDTINATKNLRYLYDNPKYTNMTKNLKIVKAFETLKIFYLIGLFTFLCKLFLPLILKQLHSNNPNLHLLDIYKLNNFIIS